MMTLALPFPVKILKLSRLLPFGLLLVFKFSTAPAFGDEILVAVASNFSATAKKIALEFEEQTGHQVVLAFGSTGQHYSQIVNGAPFDMFLAADAERPRLLEAGGFGREGSSFTYALGQLVLWSPNSNSISPIDELSSGDYRYLALANPRLAPYGAAAMEALQAIELLLGRELPANATAKIVLAENVVQALQFVDSGAADLGFVSLAQINALPESERGSIFRLEANWYRPIRQQGLILSDDPVAEQFMNFLQSEPVRQKIQEAGYGLE